MKPMLAAKADVDKLRWPAFLSPKLDGVRALVVDGVVVGRSLKPIPNKHVQGIFGSPIFEGFDGELIVGSPTAPDVFNTTTSAVMSIEGFPDVTFHVFDLVNMGAATYRERYNALRKRIQDTRQPVQLVNQIRCASYHALVRHEKRLLEEGYEGVMLRHPLAPYKYGRSTVNEGALLKVKQFADSEAKIVGMACLMRNTNAAKTNELGYTERSSHKQGLVETDMMGALSVVDVHTGVAFEIGTGFTEQQRYKFWRDRDALVGRIVKYRHQPSGQKDKPRFPSFLGFRSDIDM